MSSSTRTVIARTVFAILALIAGRMADAAEWQVAKSAGEVWVATPNAQPVALGVEVVLRPGDKIQTGRSGRVLLVRGAETILVAPNSVIGLPEQQKTDRATTILQQAGSIMLEVEKQNVEHFEVETPYLAAVVKGTRFAVTVNRIGADVWVLSGTVDVAEFKTGQFSLVSAGQTARVASYGKGGLMLEGPGSLGPVQQGAPRKATLERMPVPAKGLGPPLLVPGKSETHANVPASGPSQAVAANSDGRVRIITPIGLAKLNIGALTNGLARSASSDPASAAKAGRAAPTVWGAMGAEGASEYGRNRQDNGGGNGNANASAAAANGSAGANGSANANANGSGKGKGKGKGS
jgi:FecR protein